MSGMAIGIDLGTTGVRAVLADAHGAPVARGAAGIVPEQRRDPAAWWHAVTAALDELQAQASLAGVRGLAVDGTSGTVLAIAADGTPLAPAQLYNDRADPTAVARIRQIGPADTAAHGSTSPLARMLALQHIPGVARLLHEADWIAGRLCGRFDSTDSNNALKSGFDPRSGTWPAWIDVLGLKRALLPAVVAPGIALAPLSPSIAARFGLPQTAIVVAGTTDGCASFLATGAGTEGDGVTALGSTLTLKLLSPAPIFAPEYGIYSHLVRGAWLAGGASNAGAAVLARFFSPAQLAELSRQIDPARPSGCDFYPLLATGERFPVNDPALPPRLDPRPADDAAFLHGMLEGLARIEALGYRRLAELGGPPLRRVLTVGGGAANTTWTAIRARLLGVLVAEAASTEAALGAALLALRGS